MSLPKVCASDSTLATTDDRTALINERLALGIEMGLHECRKHTLKKADPLCLSCKKRRHFLAHIERLRIIFRPFPAVRRIGTGSACPWSGVIVNDTFGLTTNGRTRPAVKTESDLYGGDYHYGPQSEGSVYAEV